MLRKILRVVGFLLAVALIVAYICYASNLARNHRATQQVEKVVISLVDSTATEVFATSEGIREQLHRKGVKIMNSSVDSVDAVFVSNNITSNGFVREANVYVTYSGEAHIEVLQHKPIARLMCGGLNSYVTAEGDVFSVPYGSAYYAPVITGCYRSFFSKRYGYEGRVDDSLNSLLDIQRFLLVDVGREMKTLKEKKSGCLSKRNELKNIHKKLFESSEAFQQRKVGAKMQLAECDEQLKKVEYERERLEKRRAAILTRKKKIAKYYDDFVNLLTFVEDINKDSFWSAEIVQFVADTTSLGEITLRLIPRSGDFVIEFGTLAERDEKLEKLRNFYDKGLSHLGWDRYRIVDLRYKKQVICTE